MELQSLEPAEPLKARPPRKPAALCAFVVGADAVISEAELTDLSYDGCGISCDTVFAVGDEVRLSVLGRGAILAHVRWCAAGKAGLCFGVPEVEPEPVERGTERVLTEALVHVRRQGGPSFRVRVYDASREGCRVDDVERFRADEPVWVRFPGIEPLEARTCWRDEFTAGLKFLNPVHPAVFDLLVARLSCPSGER